MGLGMPEVVLILVVALIVFGPRKLPELGKSLGQALAQFRRASDDFKRTWEQEVELEKTRKPDNDSSISGYPSEQSSEYSYHSDSSQHYDPYADPADQAPESHTASDEAAQSPQEPVVAGASHAEQAGPKTGAGHWI